MYSLEASMDNASLLFDSLRSYDDIKDLIGKQEEPFLDFKESRTLKGVLLDDDQAHFSKAASGFAHQQRGVGAILLQHLQHCGARAGPLCLLPAPYRTSGNPSQRSRQGCCGGALMRHWKVAMALAANEPSDPVV
jgi:hypothetical protein